jgi:hypothetical protein
MNVLSQSRLQLKSPMGTEKFDCAEKRQPLWPKDQTAITIAGHFLYFEDT